MDRAWAIALDKILKIFKFERVFLQGKVDIRSEIIHPYFLCDKAQYIFGIETVEVDRKNKSGIKEGPNVLEETELERIIISKRSLDANKQFRELQHSVLNSVNEMAVRHFLKFIDDWKPEKSLQHKKFAEFKEELMSGGLIAFECLGECLHKNASVKSAWERYLATVSSKETKEMQCLVSGKTEPVSRTHKWIKGVKGTQAQGAPLISFNDDCFCSYGRDQSYNSPVSAIAMFKYTTVLNYLLEWESKNKIQIGDTTVVFWAETDNKICENLAFSLLDSDDADDSDDEKTQQVDRGTRQLVNDILKKVKSGGYLEEKDLGIDPKTNFFILGLSPNQGRLVVRYWYQDNFGNFIRRLARYHLEMEIDRDERGPRCIPMKWLLKMTVPEKSDDKAMSPLLLGLFMRSILDGTPYPISMYNAILNRAKVERSINYARAGFIKACLIRMARTRGKNEEKMITVSLNEENKDVSYRLGRLFAVLEKAQSDSNKDMKIKSTINSKFFSSASTMPAVVFPVLIKLAQHHIAKSDWGTKSNQEIADILYDVDKWPTSLNLEEQGMFMLGYYHQRKANYRKKSSNEEMNEVENITEAES
jgi:CRISPR-associated protein Csd1